MGWLDRFRRNTGDDDRGSADAPEPEPEERAGGGADAAAADALALLQLARSGAPLPDQRRALAGYLRDRGVSKAGIQALLARTRDAVALLPGDGARTTRLGGEPLLPAGEAWPQSPDGRPLSFIAAIDLGELPELAPLPPSGTLLVYWDQEFAEVDPMDFVAATRVYYVEAGGPTQAHVSPNPDLAFGPVALQGFSMPLAGEFDLLEAPDADEDALYHAWDGLGMMQRHHLLGSSRDVQGPVLDEVSYWLRNARPESRERYGEAELRGEGWLLLAQFEEVDGLVFGDSGALYLVMPQDDLRRRRFDRVMGIMQCY